VIGSSGSEQSRSIYIDKGTHDGIKPDMPVITAEGVVGKVLRTFKSTSQVLLINDQTSGVGAILEKSRLQGVVRGTALGEVVLEKVMSDETVQSGDRVLTSGGDQIFPKGLAVGTVTKVSPGSELFLNIRVRPAADLSRLEEVLVITQQQEKEPALSDGALPLRAAEILAQRLPSVPDRPPDDPNAPPPPTSGLKIYGGPAVPSVAGANPGGSGASAANPKPHADAAGTPGSATFTTKPDGLSAKPVVPQKPHAPAASDNATKTTYSQSQPASSKTVSQPKPPANTTPTQEPPQ